MDSSNICVQDVLEMSNITFKELQDAGQRVSADSEVKSGLDALSSGINNVNLYLEFVVDDEDMTDRLQCITVNQEPFLKSLNGDLKTICDGLQDVGIDQDLSKHEVNTWTRATARYSDILRDVREHNTTSRMAHIDDGITLISDAIAAMRMQTDRNAQPSRHKLLDHLERLRPLKSAFHDSQNEPEAVADDSVQAVIGEIIAWVNDSDSSRTGDMVYFLYGDDRSTTSAIAWRVATQAQREDHLVSSFFFAWNGNETKRDPAHLVPTVAYGLAQCDQSTLRKMSAVMEANRDIRDKSTDIQISLLLTKPFNDSSLADTRSPHPVIVIDALDTCNKLDVAQIARDVGQFIRTLVQLRIKVLLTSRFSREIEEILAGDGPLKVRRARLSLPNQGMSGTDRVALDPELLAILDPVFSAHWDARGSPPGCLKGTRVDVVSHIVEWCNQESERFSVYWLAGRAGTGKSAIARTLCTQLVSTGKAWVITFFASRDATERRDPLRILLTFAWELARRDVVIHQRMLAVLCLHPDLKHRPIKEQIELLLLPAFECSLGVSIIMVLDALDECSVITGVEGGSLVHDLALTLVGFPVKLIVTSRMENSLQLVFASLPQQVTQFLHEIEDTSVTSDVRLILTDGFAKIADKRGMPGSTWPDVKYINDLVERTGRFIIFAATLLKFVENDRFSPEHRLREILDNTSMPGSSPEFYCVDALYLSVLIAAASSNQVIAAADPVLCERIRVLIGTIVLVQRPLSITALAQLMRAPSGEVECDIRALSAVLMIGPEQDSRGEPVVRALHLSFRDYLISRCEDRRFRIDEPEHHLRLTLNCLICLNTSMRRDMCNIGNPTISNSKLIDPPLSERLREYVPSAIQYSGQYWMLHNLQSKDPDSTLVTVMQAFVDQHSFRWMELLSLIAHVPFAVQYLPQVTAWWTKQTSKYTFEGKDDILRMFALLDDLHHVLHTYRTVIASHALQIYYSVWMTMPRSQLVDLMKTDAMNDRPRLVTERWARWNSGWMVFEGHMSDVWSVASSPDGIHVASGADDRTVRLWNIQTGHQTAMFEGHAGTVYSLAFLHNGRFIGSLTGEQYLTIRIWDIQTQEQITHTKMKIDVGYCFCAAFSQDGLKIVSNHFDNDLWLWNALTGELITNMKGHTDLVESVVFSQDGTRIVSGSRDMTTRIWDVQRGFQIMKFEGHIDQIFSVALSPDGSRIASGSADRSIRTWDTRSGRAISTTKDCDGRILSVAFSPDGSQIVSGSSDRAVCLWDAFTLKEIAHFEGHSDWVISVSFSLTGPYIVSGSSDNTVRLWNTQSHNFLRSHRNNDTGLVRSVAFSPDGTQIVVVLCGGSFRSWDTGTGQEIGRRKEETHQIQNIAFSPDGTRLITHNHYDSLQATDPSMLLWNTQTGDEIQSLGRHTNRIHSVAFSPDSQTIVSGSDFKGKHLQLWNAQTGKRITELDGHADTVEFVVFSPDGLYIVSGDELGDVIVWDFKSRCEVARLKISDRFPSYNCILEAISMTPQISLTEFEHAIPPEPVTRLSHVSKLKDLMRRLPGMQRASVSSSDRNLSEHETQPTGPPSWMSSFLEPKRQATCSRSISFNGHLAGSY